jgi:hypothetical protein
MQKLQRSHFPDAITAHACFVLATTGASTRLLFTFKIQSQQPAGSRSSSPDGHHWL